MKNELEKLVEFAEEAGTEGDCLYIEYNEKRYYDFKELKSVVG